MAQAKAQPKQTATQAKLSTFQWQGVDKKGNKTSGEKQGRSMAVVKAELRKQGINTNKIKKKAEQIACENFPTAKDI